MARRFPSGLRTVLVVLLLAAALPAIGALLWAGWTHRRESVQTATQQALAEALDSAEDLGVAVGEARAVLLRLAADAAVARGDAPACSAAARTLLPLFPTFGDIGGVRPDGTPFCSAHAALPSPGPPAAAPADRAWLDQALGTRGVVLRELPAGAAGSSATVACLLALRDERDQPIGVLLVTLPPARLAEIVAPRGLPQGTTVTALDGTGTVLIRRPDAQGWVGRQLTSEPLWQAVAGQATERSALTTDLDGTTMVFGVARIPPTGEAVDAWVAVGIPHAAVTAQPERRLGGQLGGAGIALLLAVAATWIGIDRFVLRPVRNLRHVAQELAEGRLEARSGGAMGALELRELGQGFDEMAERLERSLGETRGALEAVREGRARLQSLSRALLESQEAERHQLARELHDEIGQALTAARLNLDALRAGQRDPETSQRIATASEVVASALEQVRNLSLDLRPSILDDLGLVPALRWYVARQAERTGVPVDLAARGLEERPPAAIETACFRIAQEAVTNALRHAHPARIRIEVERRGEDLVLAVRDDGAGFVVDQARERARRSGSFGLLGMEERAALLGGSFCVDSRPGGGTEVRATLLLVRAGQAGAAA